MKNNWIKLTSVLVLGAYLAACGDADTNNEETGEDTEEVVDETELDNQEEDHDHEEEQDDDQDEEEHDDEESHDNDEEDEDHEHGHDHEDDFDAPETVEIEGVEHHYHTGELVELTAILDEETDHDHWHWYVREDHDDEWETVPEQLAEDFIYEAPEESFEVRAVLFGEDHEAVAQSEAVEIIVDNH